jgi:hypothetical protein
MSVLLVCWLVVRRRDAARIRWRLGSAWELKRI